MTVPLVLGRRLSWPSAVKSRGSSAEAVRTLSPILNAFDVVDISIYFPAIFYNGLEAIELLRGELYQLWF